jgi:hypothetical protein
MAQMLLLFHSRLCAILNKSTSNYANAFKFEKIIAQKLERDLKAYTMAYRPASMKSCQVRMLCLLLTLSSRLTCPLVCLESDTVQKIVSFWVEQNRSTLEIYVGM